MTRQSESRYIRYREKPPIIRYWVATLLLRGDLESHLMFSRLDPFIVAGFTDAGSLTKENLEDAAFLRDWLGAERDRCVGSSIDEDDIFSANTRELRRVVGLTATELAILRFACLLTCYKPLEAAAEAAGDAFSETDVCDLLAEQLGLPFDEIYAALHPDSLLRRAGLVRIGDRWASNQRLGSWLCIPEMLARQVFRSHDDSGVMVNALFRQARPTSLSMRDFGHVKSELMLARDYLKASFEHRATGTNILIWGRPGTGKTELARYLARSLRKQALEILAADRDNEALTAPMRLDCYRLCQAVIGRMKRSLVIFDEVEEILSDNMFAEKGFKGEGRFTKGLINEVLETNAAPTIWITNTVCGVDPAYLRRFDIVLHLKTPIPEVKARIARRVFGDLPLDRGLVKRIVQNRSITPAHLQKVTKICRRLKVESASEAGTVANHVLKGDLEAIRGRPLEPAKTRRRGGLRLNYDPSLINCDVDVERLAASLRADSSVRICLFGPPGTGKTAWAQHLAKCVRRPLIVKHAADILDKYLGGTEKNIADAFSEAELSRSVLLLDEVDSFLPDRAKAARSWEITQANQFLTAMEHYEGILVCTTNLPTNLDPATMRRFDFKIELDYLRPDQALAMAAELLKTFGIKLTRESKSLLEADLNGLKLAQGDFTALLRRYTAIGGDLTVRQLSEDLKKEAAFRTEGKKRSIGFVVPT